jgi:hypothetical protein
VLTQRRHFLLRRAAFQAAACQNGVKADNQVERVPELTCCGLEGRAPMTTAAPAIRFYKSVTIPLPGLATIVGYSP